MNPGLRETCLVDRLLKAAAILVVCNGCGDNSKPTPVAAVKTSLAADLENQVGQRVTLAGTYTGPGPDAVVTDRGTVRVFGDLLDVDGSKVAYGSFVKVSGVLRYRAPAADAQPRDDTAPGFYYLENPQVMKAKGSAVNPSGHTNGRYA